MATEIHSAVLTRLDHLSRHEVAFAGREGAVLADLARAAFPVPPGFVVSGPAAAEAPEAVEHAISDAYRELGEDIEVEVRSSPDDRDTMSAPIGVRGAEALLAAVRRCWASRPDAAVVVQRRIAAAKPGVMFTVDTATRDPDRIVIEARGASPNRYVVDKLLLGIVERGHDGDIDAREARLVADLGRSVEHHYRRPQEIEWAFDEHGHLWLLHARPLTGTAVR
jgi:phosphoenolpyruvate synthase/pyruvate phosphate dikinase